MAGIAVKKLKIVDGVESVVFIENGFTQYVHCHRCCSLLYAVTRDGAYAHVTMGTLVDTPSIRPTHHIFVGSKAAWFEITDDLPQYENFKEPP